MVNWRSKKLGDLLLLANGIVLVIFLNLISSFLFYRLDLTEEKRFSIKPQTKKILSELDDDVFVEVYLEGELNAGFKRFSKSIRETLEEFSVYSGRKVKYSFIDPSTAVGEKARGEFMADIAAKGIQPTNVIGTENGKRTERIIFPGAVVSYGGQEKGLMLLKGNKAVTSEERINQSIEGLEFELANAVYQLANADQKMVGIVKGHGELDSVDVTGFYSTLAGIYHVADVRLTDASLNDFDALIIAKPTSAFAETDKYFLDQYIMQGGNVLLALDKLDATMDSAASKTYFAFPYATNLEDQLFRYGVRINNELVLDENAGQYPVVIGQSGSTPHMQLLPLPYYPLINNYPDHVITRNLDGALLRFASTIDTVKAPGIRKTPLLQTSKFTRKVSAPANVNINQFRNEQNTAYTAGVLTVGYLLEGRFLSLFKNRFLPEGAKKENHIDDGEPAKIIVVSDGDIIRNEVNRRSGQPQPLGYDPFTKYTYANQDLMLNMLAYLTEENGLIFARNKEVKIRPLDRNRISEEKFEWQFLNLVVPVVFIVLYGMGRAYLRRRRYTRFT
jgi:ABC-2 type transport system permease protein